MKRRIVRTPEPEPPLPFGQIDVLAERDVAPFVVDFVPLLQAAIARFHDVKEEEVYRKIRPPQRPKHLGYHIEDED
jgi:hypothetical protein